MEVRSACRGGAVNGTTFTPLAPFPDLGLPIPLSDPVALQSLALGNFRAVACNGLLPAHVVGVSRCWGSADARSTKFPSKGCGWNNANLDGFDLLLCMSGDDTVPSCCRKRGAVSAGESEGDLTARSLGDRTGESDADTPLTIVAPAPRESAVATPRCDCSGEGTPQQASIMMRGDDPNTRPGGDALTAPSSSVGENAPVTPFATTVTSGRLSRREGGERVGSWDSH